MAAFIIDLPVPSMGATVSELTVVTIAVRPGAPVVKGQKLAELESDKSAFDFESPVAGTILEIKGAPGGVMSSGQPLFRMQTEDAGVRHLEVSETGSREMKTAHAEFGTVNRDLAAGAAPAPEASDVRSLVWTPRAMKLAQEAGLDHATVADIDATGPGGRVSGDDVVRYLEARKKS